MGKQSWQSSSRSPGRRGSVKRMRERLDMGAKLQASPVSSQDGNFSPTNDPPKMRPPIPAALAEPRNFQDGIGVAISKPTQVTQWPLPGPIEAASDYQPQVSRGFAPQRPPRPRYVPSMLDPTRLQGPMPSFQNPPKASRNAEADREEEDIVSPISRSSLSYTAGQIAAFPLPSQTGLSRRSVMGPPPTLRRGASAYYSQASFVSPIPEESPRLKDTHGSYASSAAIPTNWGSDQIFGFPYDDGKEDEHDDPNAENVEIFMDERVIRGNQIEKKSMAREINDDNDNDDDNDGAKVDRGLISHASFGQRAKSSMVTPRNSERIDPTQQSSEDVVPAPPDGVRTMPPKWPIIGNADSPLATGTGYIESTSSSSGGESEEIGTAITTASNTDPKPMPTRPQKLSLIENEKKLTGYSRMSAIRRPPRLDIDMVREAESRGSLTSLSDLIRRATKLAALIDRGKRPGSRVMLDDYSGDSAQTRDMNSEDSLRRSGFSGLLAAFPPPGANPGVDVTDTIRKSLTRPDSTWPAVADTTPPSSPSKSVGNASRARRQRCCGLSCFRFAIIIFIAIMLALTVIILPVFFLVINKDGPNVNKNNNKDNELPSSSPPPSTASTLESCAADPATTCLNGGSSFLLDSPNVMYTNPPKNGNICACICTNGFTGSTCATSNANVTGCVTATMPGGFDATLGSSITRLIEYGPINFSVPLNASLILARFNNASMSCAAQNALVTFQSKSMKRDEDELEKIDEGALENTETKSQQEGVAFLVDGMGSLVDEFIPTATFAPDNISSASNQIPTSLSSLSSPSPSLSSPSPSLSSPSPSLSSPSPSLSSPSPSLSPPSPSSSSSSSSSSTITLNAPSPTSTSQVHLTPITLDFARVAILFIQQILSVDTAITAQQNLEWQLILGLLTPTTIRNVTVGVVGLNGRSVSLDFLAMAVDVGGGVIGGRGASIKQSRNVHAEGKDDSALKQGAGLWLDFC